jgi:hypothetical protein
MLDSAMIRKLWGILIVRCAPPGHEGSCDPNPFFSVHLNFLNKSVFPLGDKKLLKMEHKPMEINLSDLNESYRSSESRFAGALPNGIYDARLVSAEISLSKNDNRQIQWIFEAEMSSGKLGTTMKFSPLLERSIPYLRNDLEKLHIFIDDLNELHQIIPELIGSVIEIEVFDDNSIGSHRVDFLKKVSGPKK